MLKNDNNYQNALSKIKINYTELNDENAKKFSQEKSYQKLQKKSTNSSTNENLNGV